MERAAPLTDRRGRSRSRHNGSGHPAHEWEQGSFEHGSGVDCVARDVRANCQGMCKRVAIAAGVIAMNRVSIWDNHVVHPDGMT